MKRYSNGIYVVLKVYLPEKLFNRLSYFELLLGTLGKTSYHHYNILKDKVLCYLF